MSILDEIVLLPPSLAVLDPMAADVDLRCLQQSAESIRQTKSLTARLLPWVLTSTTPAQAGSRWVDLCRQFHAQGLAIQCSASDLESVPIQALPKRIALQSIELSFSISEFESADVVEIALYSAVGGRWGFPPELGKEQNLLGFMDAIRLAAGEGTAIAIGIPIGLDVASTERIVSARPDVLSLTASDSTSDELIVATLARTQSVLQDSSLGELPILLKSHHSKSEQLVKLLALGAATVNIDRAIDSIWEVKPEAQSGFLSSVQTGIGEKEVCPIQARLQVLNNALLRSLDLTKAYSLTQLRGRLRATSDRAARLANIPFLEG